jgi:hypothetical protein
VGLHVNAEFGREAKGRIFGADEDGQVAQPSG